MKGPQCRGSGCETFHTWANLEGHSLSLSWLLSTSLTASWAFAEASHVSLVGTLFDLVLLERIIGG